MSLIILINTYITLQPYYIGKISIHSKALVNGCIQTHLYINYKIFYNVSKLSHSNQLSKIIKYIYVTYLYLLCWLKEVHKVNCKL